MRFLKGNTYQDMSRIAANQIAAQIISKPDSVLGLATGSTPIGLYEYLVKWYKEGDLDFSEISSVNLDEYRGLDGTSDQSYRYFMNTHLFDHVNIDKAKTYVPNGLAEDAGKECARYDALIVSKGGQDLQLLGLGNNGHIGFNEPADCFEPGTHCVTLADSTIQANARFFASAAEVPTQAYTMGIRNIMQAKKVVVVVNGKAKAEAVKNAFFGPITPKVPASILQLHKDVTIIGDAEAFSLIN
ncbi:MAG: glucosamine-6-phosphate deaminase [Lachnospiraceae bacterium]|nr:glucosamine-6-phosphate deaminase [Lachnospiraceae bacterium]